MAIQQKVLVAMSGGVDSSVAAALLVEQGYQVVGVMLRLWCEEGQQRENACCTNESIHTAQLIAEQLNIPFQVIDATEPFRSLVVQYFLDEYSRGLTPNPCIICNRTIKWGFLLDYAKAQGFDAVASGHYARIMPNASGELELWCGVDSNKDQSYMLYSLCQDQLKHILFPLGELHKGEVRQIAAKYGFASANKQESQDLCFIPDKDYRQFLLKYMPNTAKPGNIVDTQGNILGEHKGLAFYTIGQRRGLHISTNEPYYVLHKNMINNELICAPLSLLGRQQFTIHQFHWISTQKPNLPFDCFVKTRYKSNFFQAKVFPFIEEDKASVHLTEKVKDITPGQFAVFYCNAQCHVLGGGVIQAES